MRLLEESTKLVFDAQQFTGSEDSSLDIEDDGPDGLEDATAAVIAALQERAEQAAAARRPDKKYHTGVGEEIEADGAGDSRGTIDASAGSSVDAATPGNRDRGNRDRGQRDRGQVSRSEGRPSGNQRAPDQRGSDRRSRSEQPQRQRSSDHRSEQTGTPSPGDDRDRRKPKSELPPQEIQQHAVGTDDLSDASETRDAAGDPSVVRSRNRRRRSGRSKEGGKDSAPRVPLDVQPADAPSQAEKVDGTESAPVARKRNRRRGRRRGGAAGQNDQQA